MKRQREADERERVRLREQRRAERRMNRSEASVTDDTSSTAPQGPVLGVDGPRSLAELRAARAAAEGSDQSADSSTDD